MNAPRKRELIASAAHASDHQRRSQAERSYTMRKRLQDAAIQQLIEDGYEHTSVSSICKRARVSRGAFLHQYPSKHGLIEDVARTLMRDTYRRLGQVLLEVADEEDRLQTLIDSTWSELFDSPRYQAYLELQNASQSDRDLAALLQRISLDVLRPLDQAVDHYFKPISADSFQAKDLFILTRWLLSGMASDSHLVDNPGYIRRHLDIWRQLLATQIRPRKSVTEPPPRLHSI